MTDHRKLHRDHQNMAALGLPDFETVDDCARRQTAMIKNLNRNGSATNLFEGLDDCSADRCGMLECREACHFGSRRRRLKGVPLLVDLVQKHEGPAFAVTVVHPDWAWKDGEALDLPRIQAALDWWQNRLSQASPSLAVGVWEFCQNIGLDGTKTWVGHIHGITVGTSRESLKAALALETTPDSSPYSKPLKIQRIGNLARQIAYTIKRFAEKRVTYIDSQGRRNQRHLPLNGRDLARFDATMLQIKIGERGIIKEHLD